MRILITTDVPSVVGGTQTYLADLIPRLRARGHEVGLLAGRVGDPNRRPLAGADIPHWTLENAKEEASAGVDDWRPEVVYSHGMLDPTFEVGLSARLPTVHFAHNYGGLCISGTKLYKFPAPAICGKPFDAACLACYPLRRCGGRNPIESIRLYRREAKRRMMFDSCRTVLAASNHMRETLIQNGVDGGKIEVAPLYPPDSSIDAAPPAPRAFTNRILFIGRLSNLKGWRELLNAIPIASASLQRKLTLVIAGDGPDGAELAATAKALEVPIEVHSWVDPPQRERLMRSADVLAFPSIWPEPFGLVGLEAGCVGLPTVAFDVGGVRDWLEPGVAGELASAARPNPRNFASAVVRAIGDPSHWQRLREGAWRNVARFSAPIHVDRLEQILCRAAGR